VERSTGTHEIPTLSRIDSAGLLAAVDRLYDELLRNPADLDSASLKILYGNLRELYV
jgi:hypothetical protein